MVKKLPELVMWSKIRFKNLLHVIVRTARSVHSFLYFFRNFRQNGEGTVEEIGFKEFLVVMSHFKPPSLHMTQEQRESIRRDKLRCVSSNHMITCLTLSVADTQLLN